MDIKIFESWQYIFSELIQRNSKLTEKVSQLEKQVHQLAEQNVQIQDLQKMNKELKQKFDEHILQRSDEKSKHDTSDSVKKLEESANRFNNCIIQLASRVNNNSFQIKTLETENKQLKQHSQMLTEQCNELREKSDSSASSNNKQSQTSSKDSVDVDNVTTTVSGSVEKYSQIEGANESLYDRLNIIKQEDYAYLEITQRSDNSSILNLDRWILIDEDMRANIYQLWNMDDLYTGLVLDHNHITPSGSLLLAEILSVKSRLTLLSLSYNNISDEGVHALAKTLSNERSSLSELYLGCNGITDVGANHIAQMLTKNKSITHLYLFGNRITDSGLQILAEAIEKYNSTIQVLSLDSQECITNESIDYLLQMIRNHPSLEKLYLTDCNLSQKGKERLSKNDFDEFGFRLNTDSHSTCYVSIIEWNSPAAAGGLNIHDIILAVDNRHTRKLNLSIVEAVIKESKTPDIVIQSGANNRPLSIPSSMSFIQQSLYNQTTQVYHQRSASIVALCDFTEKSSISMDNCICNHFIDRRKYSSTECANDPGSRAAIDINLALP
ncbi:unnamed protein product [Adineta ricciae]|uniref:PDZ domain-containing protein n=1 Tax=Adineta ricciae TaxID=249248 RepID=A0A814FB21_ADIRI|nr:unnamed protein product [Adineta ricciae]